MLSSTHFYPTIWSQINIVINITHNKKKKQRRDRVIYRKAELAYLDRMKCIVLYTAN